MSKNPEHGRGFIIGGPDGGIATAPTGSRVRSRFFLTKVNEARTRTLKMNWTVAVERKRSSKEPPCPDLLNTAPCPRYVPRCLPGAAEADPVSHGRDFPRMDIDVTEAGDKYVLKAELPGVEKNISVEIDGATVMILANKEQSSEVRMKARFCARNVTGADPTLGDAGQSDRFGRCQGRMRERRAGADLAEKRAATAGCCRSSRSCKAGRDQRRRRWRRRARPEPGEHHE